jgi:hypothetical protein
MNTEAVGGPLHPSAPPADRLIARPVSTPRVRAYRERRRLGVRCVKVPVSKTSIEAFVRMGYLPDALQQDVGAFRKPSRPISPMPRLCRNSVPEASWRPANGVSGVMEPGGPRPSRRAILPPAFQTS